MIENLEFNLCKKMPLCNNDWGRRVHSADLIALSTFCTILAYLHANLAAPNNIETTRDFSNTLTPLFSNKLGINSFHFIY